jgi:hypothetical protein
VAWFFEDPWKRVVSALAEADRGWLLNEAGFDLCALGRVIEAVEPMRAALEMAVAREDWKPAAIRGKNHMADVHLHRARLFHDRDELVRARHLIETCGYRRRRGEREDAARDSASWP